MKIHELNSERREGVQKELGMQFLDAETGTFFGGKCVAETKGLRINSTNINDNNREVLIENIIKYNQMRKLKYLLPNRKILKLMQKIVHS